MKKIEIKIAVVCVLFISFILICIGTQVYNSKGHLDKFNMEIADVKAECVRGDAIYLAELKSFKSGEYIWKFD